MRAAQAFDIIVDALKLWWKDWVNQLVVSLVTILLSLTVVLAPAAMFGVYNECKDLTHNSRTGVLGFWEGFKSYFKQNLAWGAINLLVFLVLFTNVWFYYYAELVLAPYLTIVTILMLAFWIVWQSYSLACFFLQDQKKLKLAWKNGLSIMLLHPLYTAIIGITILALVVASFRWFVPLFMGSIPLIALLSFRAVQATLPPDESHPNESSSVT